MARLGVALSVPGIFRSTVTQSAPGGSYDDITAIRYNELPSGGGAGKDYAVVVMGNVGRLSSADINSRMQTRWGLRFGIVEEPTTWSTIEHLGNPLTGSGVNVPSYGLPWQIVHLVRDWPVGQDLILSAQHIRSTQPWGYAEIDNVFLMAVDLTAMGGSRVGNGWFGSRAVVAEASYVGGLALPSLATAAPTQLLTTSLLPWSLGTDTWVGFWSQSIHPKSAIHPVQLWGISPGTDTWDPPFADWHAITRLRSRTVHVGSAGALDGANYYSLGSFAPFEVTGSASSFRVLAGSAYPVGALDAPARTVGGCLVAIRLDELDGDFAQSVPGTIIDAVGSVPGIVGPVQQYQVDVPRDTSRWVSMARLITAETPAVGGGLLDTAAVGVVTRQNGNAQRDSLQLLHPYRVIGANEQLPVACAVAVPPPRYAWEGGNFFGADWFLHPTTRPAGVTYVRGQDRVAVAFALRDDGPQTPPTPSPYTRIVYDWTTEGPDIGSIPEFAVAPSGHGVATWSGDHTQEIRSTDGYLLRWGGPASLRRTVPVRWTALSRSELATVQADIDADEVRVRRWMPRDEVVEVVWAILPGTFRSEAGADGGFSAECRAAEVLWYQ